MGEIGTLLFVDDEQGILNSLRRLFIDDNVRILTSTSGAEAIELIKSNDIAVIVSDHRMPGMSGIEFLQKAKALSPDSVRVMLTGYADTQAAIDAINKGEVYKFITKPWEIDEFRSIIFDAVGRHNVVQSLRKADEYTLYSLAQTIELKDPYTKGHCDRVAKYATTVAEALGLDEELKKDIRRGGWLHDCGKIGVPEALLNFKGPLTPEQMVVLKKHPCWGADVARSAHLPQAVVNIVLYHHERYDGTGYPLGLKGEDIPLEARIVNVADIYDSLTSERPYRDQLPKEEAIEILRANKATHSDPHIVDIFIRLLEED